MQDKIANRAKDVAGIMLGRQMGIPKVIEPAMLEFVASSIAAAEQALVAINELH
jgi:hypothetical protein